MQVHQTPSDAKLNLMTQAAEPAPGQWTSFLVASAYSVIRYSNVSAAFSKIIIHSKVDSWNGRSFEILNLSQGETRAWCWSSQRRLAKLSRGTSSTILHELPLGWKSPSWAGDSDMTSWRWHEVFKTNDWDQPEIQYSTGASNQASTNMWCGWNSGRSVSPKLLLRLHYRFLVPGHFEKKHAVVSDNALATLFDELCEKNNDAPLRTQAWINIEENFGMFQRFTVNWAILRYGHTRLQVHSGSIFAIVLPCYIQQSTVTARSTTSPQWFSLMTSKHGIFLSNLCRPFRDRPLDLVKFRH